MKNLPQEILGIICEYADVKCRNGVYIGQIAATDPRRDLLGNIERTREINNNFNTLQKNYYVNLTLCQIVYFPEDYSKNITYQTPQCKYGHYCYSFYCISPPKHTKRTIYKIDLSGVCFIRIDKTITHFV